MKRNVLKSLILFPAEIIIFCALNKVYGDMPLATGAYIGAVMCGAPLFVSGLSFLLSFAVYKDVFMFLCGAVFFFVFTACFCIYRKLKKRPTFEIILFLFIAAIPYIVKDFYIYGIQKLVYMAIIAVFSKISEAAAGAVAIKKINRYISVYEALSTAAFYVITAMGFINIFGLSVYRPLSLIVFILLARYFKSAAGLAVAIAITFPPAITSLDYEWLVAAPVLFSFYLVSVKCPSPIIALSVATGDVFCGLILSVYPSYGVFEAAADFIALMITSFVSEKTMDNLRDKYNFDFKATLTKSAINKNRADASKHLYDISNVFFQMRDCFKNLKKYADGTEDLLDKIAEEAICAMCLKCNMKERCIRRNAPPKALIKEIIKTGMLKGRVTVVDIPGEFSEICGRTNTAIYEINRLIGEYSGQIGKAEQSDEAKEILSMQSDGVGGVLKALALTLSKTAAENTKDERRIFKALVKKGVRCEGVICFGEGDDTEIQILCPTPALKEHDIAKILSDAFSIKLCLCRAEPVANGLSSATLKIAPEYDAVFGISKVTKNSSPASGDCHSLIKINESNFLIALSDGMGSGTTAEKTSTTSLDLIESLYKAGLESEFILALVNKLLTISVDDNFSAVDIALVNLREGTAGFIKIGAPYGFILSDDGIRFIEGSSLPLGILDEFHPTTAEMTVSDNDVILLVSDGVTDAFGSSTGFIEFLKSAPIHNPQVLADAIVGKALQLSGGQAEDDITALAVRLVSSLSESSEDISKAA